MDGDQEPDSRSSAYLFVFGSGLNSSNLPFVFQAKEFAKGVHAIRPGHWLAYNLSPSFNWDAAGLGTKDMEQYVWQLGKLGFVWQFITVSDILY